MKAVRLLVVTVVVGAATDLLRADLITIGVEGVVQRSDRTGISVGDIMAGYCVYDTTKPDTLPETYMGKYQLESLVMMIKDYRFEHSPGTAQKAWFSVWATDVAYKAETNRGLMLRNNDPVGQPTLWFKMIDLCNAQASGTDAFPISFPDDISFFSWRNEWQVYNGTNHVVSGKLTTIGIIPEPATLPLLLFGAFCLRKRP